MLVFWKARLAVLAVPKTGTSALEEAFLAHADIAVRNPPELKHAPVYRYNRFFRPMFEKMGAADMETLALVREPVSWLGSWYRYRRRPGLEGHRNSTHGVSFDAFVEAWLAPRRPAFADVGSQANFLAPRPNGLKVTHLFRYEDMDRALDFLAERIGVRPQLQRRNVSPDIPLSLSPRTLARLRRKARADFALWEDLAIADSEPGTAMSADGPSAKPRD